MSTELQRLLGRIEATQELILAELKDQRKRVSALENRMWTLNGAIGVLFVVWTFFSDSIARALGLK